VGWFRNDSLPQKLVETGSSAVGPKNAICARLGETRFVGCLRVQIDGGKASFNRDDRKSATQRPVLGIDSYPFALMRFELRPQGV
jgi:hypothetical protein